ncbi:MAG: DUF2071 domain-containing protein [Verrucomicrobiales bacterium]|nr:DUF2071 domain-containing protein [Verrucomicrobiales bacterium]
MSRSTHPSLTQLQHRPWPLPSAPWNWRQSWLDLAFLHYRVEWATLRAQLPNWLELDEFDGTPWVTIVPFKMANLRTRAASWFPPLASFPELNLRTYVTVGDKPGVWFFSLDADCLPLVIAARRWFGLPYWKASIHLHRTPDAFQFTCRRSAGEALFEARYQPASNSPFFAAPGSFEKWASERYCLYSTSPNGPIRLEVHHGPWPIQRATVEVRKSDLWKAAGLTLLDPSPRCYYSSGVEVVSFPPERLASPC